jgi:P4 family phage/plasmid primase-like protien
MNQSQLSEHAYPIILRQMKKYATPIKDNDAIAKGIEPIIRKVCTTDEDFTTSLERPETCYHLRLKSKYVYAFYGDIDKYKMGDGGPIAQQRRFEALIDRILDTLAILIAENSSADISAHPKLTSKDIAITRNDNYLHESEGLMSHHFVIPHFKCSVPDMKTYIQDISNRLDIATGVLDLSVYKTKQLFRLPNQHKGIRYDVPWTNGIHRVIRGNLIDFNLIPKPDAIYITRCAQSIPRTLTQSPKSVASLSSSSSPSSSLSSSSSSLPSPSFTIDITDKEKKTAKICSAIYNSEKVIKGLFDRCYTSDYFNSRETWMQVGMALNTHFGDQKDITFDLFRYFSHKATDRAKISTDEQIRYFLKSYDKSDRVDKITIKRIHDFAIKCNSREYFAVLSENTMNLTEVDICRYLAELFPNHFIWVDAAPYCYNGKYYELQKPPRLFYDRIDTDLYIELLDKFSKIYTLGTPQFNDTQKRLLRLRTMAFKEAVAKTAAHKFARPDFLFDENKDILPFKNVVYDLKAGIFRDYKMDDYVSLTTGYDWYEPEQSEVDTLMEVISKIFPNEQTRETALTILATALDGHISQYIAFFTGKGGNGKSLLDMQVSRALGNFAYIANNTIFSKTLASADPNIASMDLKRLVLIQEPPADAKLDNSLIKTLTGGSQINARMLYSNNNKVRMNAAIILEMNEIPSLKSNISRAEERRMMIIPFISEFTSNKERINEAKHIYKVNTLLSRDDFVERHKYAMMKILMKYYTKYLENGCVIKMDEESKLETKDYMLRADDLSDILEDLIEPTDDEYAIIDTTTLYKALPPNVTKNMSYRIFLGKLKISATYGDRYVGGRGRQHSRLDGYKMTKMEGDDDDI